MRDKRLDVLRSIAVLLVMLLHAQISSVFRAGWAGVDLFFVLSGFLISGLLFSEYKARGAISFQRFFIRRGFKIYPSFYLFLLVTAVASRLVFRRFPPAAATLLNVLFVMNYTSKNAWDHLWSLGVEEHFYIFLPLLLMILIRISPNAQDPFHRLPWVAFVIALACPAFRAISVLIGTPNYHWAYAASHERIDSLFFGVLLGYASHFHALRLRDFLASRMNKEAIAFFCVLALAAPYITPRDSPWFAVGGYSLLYLGFGSVLMLTLHVHNAVPVRLVRPVSAIGSVLAYIGKHSYSIYLWHGPVGAWLPGLMRRATGVELNRTTVYLIGSIAVGILMSVMLEYPMLRIRDRFFPPRNTARITSAASEQEPALVQLTTR